MCGITGVLGAGDDGELVLQRMCDAIRHRGPDDDGAWVNPESGIALGFVRLAILDLSAAGHQPMTSAPGRFVLVFNGEVYNHLVLRAQLEQAGAAPAWRGHSDTETLLAGFEHWGIRGTIEKAVGMFAFAVWDRSDQVLTLGRDRVGEKPLYYGWQGSTFLFASELRALRRHPAFHADIDRGALALLLRHNYIPAPYSIYQGIRKLLPGTLLTVSRGRSASEPVPFWSLEKALTAPRFSGTPEETLDELEHRLADSVRGQMLSDVPLGAFLSGGVDSSLIVSLMQAQSDRPIRTFTIGFREPEYDESVYARKVAEHLGTDHTEMTVTAEDALRLIPSLPEVYSEPFADSSQIPTILVSRLARQSVTVALSGDAGDELFAGYPRYALTERLWKRLGAVPRPLRRAIASVVRSIPPGAWDVLTGHRGPATGVAGRLSGDQIRKGADLLAVPSVIELYRSLVSLWRNPASIVRDTTEPGTRFDAEPAPDAALYERLMALDLVSYLPDDILAKVDRAAMGVSLETRVPLLDHRVLEFALRLPLELKRRDGTTKWALRQLLYRRVPKELIERPKRGFAAPIAEWLRGPLRPWAEELLGDSRLRREGHFEPAAIRRAWSEHLAGRSNQQYQLWTVLMFQAWLDTA